MFTIEDINNEIDAYKKYTSYEVPYVQDVMYSKNDNYEAKVELHDLIDNKIVLYLSENIESYIYEYKKAVVWHEITHIYDFQKYINQDQVGVDNISDVLKSYSEAHAESIKLRYLLHLNLRQNIGKEKRVIVHKDKMCKLDLVSGNYGNQSIAALQEFISSKKPAYFDLGINNFCYFCGYFSLHNKNDARKLSKYVLSFYPQRYIKDLTELYNSIYSKDAILASKIYKKIKLEAMIYSISDISNI